MAHNAIAASWYVDNLASGSNAGTSWANAWQTFGAINWGSISAGDTLYLSGGSTSKIYYGTLTVGANGTSGNPITISRGVDTGHEGQVIWEMANTNGNAIRVEKNFVNITGVSGDAVAGSTNNYGIKIQNLLQSGGANAYGVYCNSAQHDIAVFHVEVSGTNTASSDDNAAGVWLSGGLSNIVVGWVYVHGPYFATASSASKYHATGINVWTLQGAGNEYTNGVFAFSNCIANLYHDGIRVGGNSTLLNNDVRNCNGSAHSDSLLVQSGSNAKIAGNFVFSTDQAVYLDNLGSDTKSNLWIFNNVLIGTNISHIVNIDPENGSYADVKIFNNTVGGTAGAYVIRGDGRGTATTTTGLDVRNNLLIVGASIYGVTLSSDTTLASSSALNYNVYQTSSGNIVFWTDGAAKTLAQLQALSPAREANGAYGSPVFVNSSANDYHLSAADSMAITNGLDLSAYFTTDKDNSPRTAPWSVGAFEYVAGGGGGGGGGSNQIASVTITNGTFSTLIIR